MSHPPSDAPVHRHFVPAAGYDWLLPLYDPVQRWLGGESALRELLERAGLAPGQRVLDVGCGTGIAVALAARLHPQTEIVGLDPDPKALARARRKLEGTDAAVRLDRGSADALPHPDASFDQVLSSFMFHHLDPQVKRSMLAEVLRVLRPGGHLHLLDFGGDGDRRDGLLARLLHRSDHLRGHYGGEIPRLLREAGFEDVRSLGERRSLFGRVTHYHAARPA